MRIVKFISFVFFIWIAIAWKVLTIAATGTGIGTTSKSSSGTLTSGVGASSYAVGDLMVVVVASDNIGTTTDGDKGDITGVSDDAGNSYSKAVQFTNVQGGGNAGATVAIYYSVLTNALTTGVHTITVTFASNVTAKALMLKGFTIGSGNSVAIETSSTHAGDGADPASITLSSLPSREYLFIRATAVETEVSSTTLTPSFTSMRAAGNFSSTTGGGAASNMAIAGEYRIVTATIQSTDPTIASADNASAMVAFYEFTPSSLPHRIINVH